MAGTWGADRIAPGERLLTAEEFAARHPSDYVELIAGRVVPLSRNDFRHGCVCARVCLALGGAFHERRTGATCSNSTFVLTRRNPDTVRGVDLCHWRDDQLPAGEVPDGLIEAPPVFVAEVKSRAESWGDVYEKVGEYLIAGVPVVVVLDPETRTASVYRPHDRPQFFDTGDDFTLPDVLPGFAVPVRRFFG